MDSPELHWYEGMFLRPHHFQTAHRHLQSRSDRGDRLTRPYWWGTRDLTLDREALAAGRLVIRSLTARLSDGLTVLVPEDGILPELDLKTALASRGSVEVWLAIPSRRPGRANVAESSAGETGAARYHIETLEADDENTGLNPQRLRVRRPNLKLLINPSELEGHDTLSRPQELGHRLASSSGWEKGGFVDRTGERPPDQFR